METYYIGIGASAGGLEALEVFFKNIPDNTNNVYIVVQHLSPDYKSMMDELLARHTNMPIHVAEDGMETEPNHVYLIPPSMNLSIYHSKLYLEAHVRHNHLNMPIDVFMRSLAQDQGKNAIGIILSGTGSDGTKGIKTIKEVGGMVIAQDLNSCKFDGMPKSAISTNMVDYVLLPDKMPEVIMNYIKSPSIHKQLAQKLQANEAIDDLTKLTLILRTYSGIDFSSYKENTIIRRIDRRIKINRCLNLKAYIDLLRDSDEEKEILYNEMFIGVTSFFRDLEAFDVLEEKIIPKFDFSKGIVRIWSTGCSTGEEVYSIAIKLLEYIEKHHINCEIKIFATDIDQRALEFAGTGYYPDSLMTEVQSDYIYKYFDKKSEGYQIKDKVRKMVVFAKHNILKDPPFSKLDLLVCRNLFIYLKSFEQQNILNNFYYSLYPNGYLWLGSSESIGDMQKGFDIIDNKWNFFKYNSAFNPQIMPNSNSNIDTYSTLERKNTIHRSRTKNSNFENILSAVLVNFLSPSIIVNESHDIVQVLGDVGKFLKVQSGRFSNNINNNMSRELSLFVNNCIRRLRSGQSEVVLKNALHFEDVTIDICGRMVVANSQKYYIISFSEQAIEQIPGEIVEIDMTEEVKSRVNTLENELQLAREGLQATIEELETSNEELQSSNEELIASNEELQSTNEELQSVNEELFTVNSEHQMKIEELTKMTNDLSNLLKNTEIGALYLDGNLCIRKITPVMSKVTNILESDIGRPIHHLSVMQAYPKIVSDIEKVSDKLQMLEREIVDQDGSYWLVRIRPYRTEYNHIEGIILTIIDITELKKADAVNVELIKKLQLSVSSGKVTWWEYNLETKELNFSDGNEDILGSSLLGLTKDMDNILSLVHPNDYDRVVDKIDRFFKGQIKDINLFYSIKNVDGKYRDHHNRASIVEYKDGEPIRVIGTIADVTEIKDYLRKNNG